MQPPPPEWGLACLWLGPALGLVHFVNAITRRQCAIPGQVVRVGAGCADVVHFASSLSVDPLTAPVSVVLLTNILYCLRVWAVAALGWVGAWPLGWGWG